MMMFLLLILSCVSFLLSFFTVHFIKEKFSESLLDLPNSRSSHITPTPRGGGLGFIAAFALISAILFLLTTCLPNSFLFQLIIAPNPSYIWIVLVPLAFIGFLDDRYGVSSVVRYLVQLLSSTLAIACFGTFPQPWLAKLGTLGQGSAIALTLIGITALINFYNFMDGLDGLVAGVSAIQLGFLAIYLDQPLLWFLVAALLGFLWWNWSPAKIFMGDVGSTVLGATIAIALLNTNNDPYLAWSALAITLPLSADAVYTLICRLIRQENIFKAHRTHLYQKLHQSGWSHAQVASTYITLTILIAIMISFFKEVGAWICLAGVVVAITSGETYLRTRRDKENV